MFLLNYTSQSYSSYFICFFLSACFCSYVIIDNIILSIQNLQDELLHIGHCHFGIFAWALSKMKLYTSKHAKCLQNIERPGYFIFWRVKEHIRGTLILSHPISYSYSYISPYFLLVMNIDCFRRSSEYSKLDVLEFI